MKVSVSFSIISITRFKWHELQESAKAILDGYHVHTIPECFSLPPIKFITYQEREIAVFLRYLDKNVEFLFIEPTILLGDSKPESFKEYTAAELT